MVQVNGMEGNGLHQRNEICLECVCQNNTLHVEDLVGCAVHHWTSVTKVFDVYTTVMLSQQRRINFPTGRGGGLSGLSGLL